MLIDAKDEIESGLEKVSVISWENILARDTRHTKLIASLTGLNNALIRKQTNLIDLIDECNVIVNDFTKTANGIRENWYLLENRM